MSSEMAEKHDVPKLLQNARDKVKLLQELIITSTYQPEQADETCISTS